MSKSVYLLLASMVLTAGCASKPYVQQSWAKTNFDEASSDCQVKAAVAVQQNGPNDWGYSVRERRFMDQCMRGQGYVRE